jgi:hypothetical protein
MDEPIDVDPWADAHREADARGLDHVGTDLLLIGLARGQGTAADVLRDLGARQGYLFGHPAPASRVAIGPLIRVGQG